MGGWGPSLGSRLEENPDAGTSRIHDTTDASDIPFGVLFDPSPDPLDGILQNKPMRTISLGSASRFSG